MTDKKRIEYIDLAKGFCILLVLAVHIIPEIGKRYDLLTCLRMPLYFCLSGMFFKDYGGFKNLFFKKADKLLIPFFSWYLISYCFYYFRVLTLGEASEYFHILDLFTRPYFYNIPLWFLLSLFWVNVIYCGVCRASRNIYVKGVMIVAITSMGVIWSLLQIPNWFFIGTAMTCLPFFFMGRMLISSPIVKEKNKRLDLAMTTGAAAIIAFSVIVLKQFLLMSYFNNKMENGSFVFLYILAASMIIITLILCKYINRLPLVSYLGRFSIIALVTHELLRNVTNRGIRLFINPDLDDIYINSLVMVIVTSLMFIVIPLCRKFLPYITAQKEWLGKKVNDSTKDNRRGLTSPSV